MERTDTICAIATAHGGAIGLLRVSGTDSFNIVGSIFRKGKADGPTINLRDVPPQSVVHGYIVDDRNTIDEVLLAVFHAPHSYTGEDSVEISFHDSTYIAQCLMRLLTDHGCRLAEPGEYTMRAFLNGKMDLVRAEAVADLIAAKNEATHRLAISHLRGDFASELSVLRDKLLKMTSLVELELDFTDQDVNFADRNELLELANNINGKITSLAESFETGRAVKEGVPVAIVGRTNVGKSTLLNRLVGEERAIVSDIHGTTRDAIEDITEINGVTFRFIDTAGLREAKDEIERIGINITRKKMETARVVLWVTDDQPTNEKLRNASLDGIKGRIIHVINKIDLQKDYQSVTKDYRSTPCAKAMPNTVRISAKYGTGIDSLKDAIYEAADITDIDNNSLIITNVRHYEALKKAAEDIHAVIEGLNHNLPSDLLSEDLRACINHLATILGGSITPEETLQSIFNHFCVGK